jgi:hypothetical protein
MPPEMFAGIPDPEDCPNPEDRAWIIALVLGSILPVFLVIFFLTPKAVEWQVRDGVLRIRTIAGHKDVARDSLLLEAAHPVDFRKETTLRPGRRNHGFNGFGFRSGYFTLGSGQEVELYLANETGALLIPRQSQVPLLVGAKDPQALLSALRDTRQTPTAAGPKSPQP